MRCFAEVTDGEGRRGRRRREREKERERGIMYVLRGKEDGGEIRERGLHCGKWKTTIRK